jgi:thymidylate kinase
MSSNQKLFCITGADGTGKSTVVKAISEKYPDAYVANIWDLLDDQQDVLFRSKRDIDGYLCALTSDSRLLFLAHALQYSTEKATKSGAGVILLNAYWYKYFATELSLGANPELVTDIAGSFPTPDKVMRLSVPVTVAADRKTHFSKYECGATGANGREDFIRFQESVLPHWNQFALPESRVVDASQPIEHVVAETLSLLNL